MAGLWIILVILIILILTGVRLINQYQRGVVLRLGRVRKDVKKTGLTIDYSGRRPNA